MIKVPYGSQTGNLHHYPSTEWVTDYTGQRHPVGPVWKDNVPFRADLRLERYGRGRSAAYFIWKSDEGIEYPMFMSDMADMLQRAVIRNGLVENGQWHVRKRGQNYGIALINQEVQQQTCEF